MKSCVGSAPTARHGSLTQARGFVAWRAKPCITESLILFIEEGKKVFLNLRLDTKDETNEEA